MLVQPRAHHGVLMDPGVVEQDMQLAPGVGAGHLLEKGEELLVTVLLVAGVGDSPGRATSRAANSVVRPLRT